MPTHPQGVGKVRRLPLGVARNRRTLSRRCPQKRCPAILSSVILRPLISLFLRRLEGHIRGLAENPSNIVSRVWLGLTLTLTLIRRDPAGALPVPVWIEDVGLWRALIAKISPIYCRQSSFAAVQASCLSFALVGLG